MPLDTSKSKEQKIEYSVIISTLPSPPEPHLNDSKDKSLHSHELAHVQEIRNFELQHVATITISLIFSAAVDLRRRRIQWSGTCAAVEVHRR